MKVNILGSGASIIRKGRRSAAFCVELAEQTLLFEAGWGVPEALLDAKIDIQNIDHIFISHPDTDHLGSLMSMLQSIAVTNHFLPEMKREKTLYLHGYPGFKEDYKRLRSILFSGTENYPIEVSESGDATQEMNGFSVISKLVSHSKVFQSIGFRLEAEGKVLAYSGDSGFDPNLIELARGSDLAILEMSLPPSWYQEHGQPNGHMWTGDCIKIARAAGIKKLLLLHLNDLIWKGDEVSQEFRKNFPGEAILAHDLQVVEL